MSHPVYNHPPHTPSLTTVPLLPSLHPLPLAFCLIFCSLPTLSSSLIHTFNIHPSISPLHPSLSSRSSWHTIFSTSLFPSPPPLLSRTYLLVDPSEREERVMDGLLMIAMNKHREICSIQSSGGIMLLKEQVKRHWHLGNWPTIWALDGTYGGESNFSHFLVLILVHPSALWRMDCDTSVVTEHVDVYIDGFSLVFDVLLGNR